MVDKGVGRQIECNLSAKSTIANLAAAEPVPALIPWILEFRRDRAKQFAIGKKSFWSEPKTIFILGFEVKKGDRLRVQGEVCRVAG